MGKGTNTTTTNTTTAPNSQAMGAYTNVLNQAQGVAATPYQSYGQELVAPFNAQQNTGVAGINQYANAAQPDINYATGQAINSSAPLSTSAIQQYMSPYTQNVVDATQNQFNNQNAQQQQGVIGNAIAQGALGGNRSAIAQAETANQQQLAQAPVIAGLENQGYNQAVQTAEQQQQTGLQGANAIGNLGVAGQTAGLTGSTAQLGAGTQQQQTQQALDAALYQQFQNQQAYPFQEAQWLAGIDTGVGSQMGGTSSGTTTAPAPSILGQIMGGTAAGTGLLGATGAFGSTGWMTPLLAGLKHGGVAQLKRENIKSVGKTHDGQIIYCFNYKGDPQLHVSLHGKEADVVKRAHGGPVHGYADGGWTSGVSGVPYGGAKGYIPSNSIVHGSGAPQAHAPAPYQPPNLQNQAASIGNLAKTIQNGVNGGGTPGTSVGGDVGPSSYGGSQGPTPLVGVAAPAPAPSGVDLFNSGSDVYARGGVVGYADGGSVDDPDIMERFARSIHKGRDLGQRALYNRTRAGIWTSDTRPENSNPDALLQGLSQIRKADGIASQNIEDHVRGFDDGGVPTFDDRFNAVNDPPSGVAPSDNNDSINPDDPVRMPSPESVKEWRDSVDHPNPALISDVPDSSDSPIVKTARGVVPTSSPVSSFAGVPSKATDDADLPSEVTLGYSPSTKSKAVTSGVADESSRMDNEYKLYPASSGIAPPAAKSNGVDWGGNSKLWPSLMSAGFGMMANRSPFLGNAIGAGGQAGMAQYAAESKAEQEAQQHADQLALEHERLERPYSEMTANEKAANARALETQKGTQANQAVIIGPNNKPMVNQTLVEAQQAAQKDFKPVFIKGEPNPITGEIGPDRIFDPTAKTVTVFTPQGMPASKPTPAPDVDTVAVVDKSGMTGLNKAQTAAPYNYAIHAPTIEKGMDVPEPDLAYIPRASTASLKADAATYLQTGKLPNAPVSRGTPLAVAAVNYRAAVQNYGNAIAQSRGTTPEQLAAMWRVAPDLPKFVMGTPGQATVSLGVAVSHLDTLKQFIDAAKFPDTPRFKQIQAQISREFGSSAATNVDAAASIVGPEIVKAIGIAGAGTGDERHEAANMFLRGGKQSTDAINVVQHLMAGQLEGKERQAKAVGMSDEMFKGLIGNRAYDLLKNLDNNTGTSLAPADKQALDWANANPNDPRSAAIKKKLGTQ